MIAGTQIKATDLAWRNINIIRARQVTCIGRTQKAITIGQNFQHTVTGNTVGMPRKHFQQREGNVLLAHPRYTFVQI